MGEAPLTEATGPLADVDPDAISLAFSSDPMLLTDHQLDVLVTELRRRRSAFLAQEAAKQLNRKTKPKPEPAPPAEQAAVRDKPMAELTSEDFFGED